MILAAIAPLPEDVPELVLASVLADGKIETVENPIKNHHRLIAEAEFAICGRVAAENHENPKVLSAIITVIIRSNTIIRFFRRKPFFIAKTRFIRQPSSASRDRKIFLSAIICRNCFRRCFRS